MLKQNTPIKQLIILILIVFLGCQKKTKNTKTTPTVITQKEKDSIEKAYTVNEMFEKGDARRYGLTPKTSRKKHKYFKTNNLLSVLDLAEKTGIKMSIAKGYYPVNLILDGRKNVKLHFNQAVFESISISDKNGKLDKPKNINLTGTIIAYRSLNIVEANNIAFDTVILRSNPDIKKRKYRNQGCSVYHGVKNLSIKYLRIDDLGSGDERYKYATAALRFHGWKNNPENVTIDELHIKSSDRHAVYLTGKHHKFGRIAIDQFGQGDTKGMSGMQDSKPGQEHEITGIWLNKCTDTSIGEIIINTKKSKGKYAFKFERGDIYFPTKIGRITILNYTDKLPLDYPPNVVEISEIIKK
ncbi:MAG TPA: hypothetical protein EYG92_10510 [Lutibacter sp.]|nr:hypothetical protein [Lutibacter sp.]